MIQFIKRILYVFKNYITESFFNFIEFIYQISIFVAFIWWIQIARKNGNLIIKNEGGSSMRESYGNNIHELELLADLTYNYIVITTFIFLLLIIRIIPFLKFLRRFCKFFDVLDDAKYSILFFQFLVCLYILGYAFAGYLLFGSKISSFSYIGKSFIGCLQILSGSITDSNLQEIHLQVGPFYYFTFLV